VGEEEEAREQQKASEACLLCWRVSVKVEEKSFLCFTRSLSLPLPIGSLFAFRQVLSPRLHFSVDVVIASPSCVHPSPGSTAAR